MKYVLILAMLAMFTSCQTSGRHNGTVGPATKWGAVIGAGLGGVVGHNKGGKTAEGVGIGAGVGGGFGYVIDLVTGNVPEPQPRPVVYTEVPRQDTIIIKKKKTIIVDVEVPVINEHKRFYWDNGRKVYIDVNGNKIYNRR